MNEPGFHPDSLIYSRVAIWGLGLMGGSLALGIKRKCAWLAGIDLDPQIIIQAMDRGLIDQGSIKPQEVLNDIDVIILATPISSILAILDELPCIYPGTAFVMDLGSTKRTILQKMNALPDRFDSIGAHPMCGKEKGSLNNAEAGIYQGAPFALVSHPGTTSQAKLLAEEIARSIGSVPLWIDAETHDRWVAATSHVPFLVANALAQATPFDAAPLIGPGFRSTARLAGSSAKMMADILETNGEYVKERIAQFKTFLERYEQLLEQKDFAILADELEHGAEHYRALVEDRQQ
ncbi:MAG: prephenate dehydrogenase [Anaerolineaceae bacterium]|nr:prephenate dehydrogenase [Anaerolineaceae bacterium]